MPLDKPKKKLPRKMKDVKATSVQLHIDTWFCPYCERLNATVMQLDTGDIGICYVCHKPVNITEVQR